MNDNKVENFLKHLQENIENINAEARRSHDKSVMRIIDSWRKNRTAEYNGFRRKHPAWGDGAYLGGKFKKSGIDREKAWEFVKDNLGADYDENALKDLETDFDAGYSDEETDLKWRKNKFGM